jgi:hypothetical protein
MQRRLPQILNAPHRVVAIQLLVCGLASLPSVHARGLLRVVRDSSKQPSFAPFSLDRVAANLQQLADAVPEEDYQDKLIKHADCSCDEQADPTAEEADANVNDEAFQIAPSWGTHLVASPPPTYELKLLQRSDHRRSLRTMIQSDRRHGRSQSRCACQSQHLFASSSSTKALAASGESNALAVAASSKGAGSSDGTGLWLQTCEYSHADLVFWKLTNSAYFPDGIVLDHTIAYTDTCDLCSYNNLGCNKTKDVELMNGNCLCMWRVNGVDMRSQLVPCGDCVTSCIGVYKTFDIGKVEPAMQKGLCLRKKDMNAFGSLTPLTG